MKKLQGAGLRGQSAGQTSLSTVEQEGSLRYLGFSIEDLASHASFEEVAYLLLLGELPNKNNLDFSRFGPGETQSLFPIRILHEIY